MNTNIQIVLLRTTAGKFIFKPWGINKLLLPLFGYFLDGIRGLMIGLFFGFILDMRFVAKENHGSKNKTKAKADNRVYKLMLGVYALQVTEAVKYLSFETILQKMAQLTEADYMQNRKYFLQELLHQRMQVNAACKQLIGALNTQERIQFLTALYNVILVPNVQSEKRKSVILFLGKNLEIPIDSVESILQVVQAALGIPENNFRLLGVSPASDYATVKRAYYTLVKKYHPDASVHVSDEEKKTLIVQFRKIKEAYDNICHANNWK